MSRRYIEGLVRKIQTNAFAPRTASDHLAAIETLTAPYSNWSARKFGNEKRIRDGQAHEVMFNLQT